MLCTEMLKRLKLRRREAVIKEQETQLKDNRRMIGDLQKKQNKSDEQVSFLKTKIDRLRHRASYWRSVCERKTCNDNVSDESECTGKLKEEVRLLEQDNIELKDQVQEILAESSLDIVTYEGGRYTDDVRVCCYELLSRNVSVNSVRKVIESVLRNIVHKKAERLPQKTTVCEMLAECLSVAQAQVAEQLSKDDGAYHTLHSDGTTKHGTHFTTFDVTTVESPYH